MHGSPTAPAAVTPATSSGRGAPGRVTAVQFQTRRGLGLAAGFVAAAVLVGIAGVGTGWWLPLHLFVVGGLLSAISAATQMLAVTWSAAPAPPAVVAAGQRWALALGAVAMVTGRETDRRWLFVAGGLTVVVAMAGLATILIRVWRGAVTPRYRPAIEAYVAAVVAGIVGMSIGIVLGAGGAGSRVVDLRGAHLVLNVFGLVGLTIAGTLPFFVATQLRSKMSHRATAPAMRVTFAVLAVATAVAAGGHLAGRPGVVAGGLIAYVLGLVGVAVMLPTYTAARRRWAGPRARQLLAGLGWWAAMGLVLAVATLRATGDRDVLAALVIGGFGQILIGSLAYLGPVLRGGGHRRLTAGFAITRSWVSLVAGNAAALAALFGDRRVLTVALTVWLADLVVRGGRLVVGNGDGDDV